MLIAGFQGQAAGAAGDYDYELSPELLNGLAFAGHVLMALTVLAFVLLALRAFTKGDAVGDDPWGGQTLEWMTTSPPPTDNFTDVHTVASATPLLDLDLSRGDN
jgi:heme/copper-type cytochrome/quinol oxidase subunit 1